MELERFAQHIGGEFVAGCLIGTLDGKRQYLHRDGVFTERGLLAYQEWEGTVAIATPVDVKVQRKPHKSVED